MGSSCLAWNRPQIGQPQRKRHRHIQMRFRSPCLEGSIGKNHQRHTIKEEHPLRPESNMAVVVKANGNNVGGLVNSPPRFGTDFRGKLACSLGVPSGRSSFPVRSSGWRAVGTRTSASPPWAGPLPGGGRWTSSNTWRSCRSRGPSWWAADGVT